MKLFYRLQASLFCVLSTVVAIGFTATYSAPVLAHSDQCKWENGPGAPTYGYCKFEDCTEVGGLAICSKPEPAPYSNLGDTYTDGEKFVYGMCEMGPTMPFKTVRWCEVTGGTWQDGHCVGVPNQQYPSITSASSEGAADAAADHWVEAAHPDCTVTPTDSGWGFPNVGDPFCGGSQVLKNYSIISDVKSRQYQVSCPGQPTGTGEMKIIKNRKLICAGGHSRTLPNNDLQCFIPRGCCTRGNPVDLISGGKLQSERDYSSADGLSFTRYYTSTNHFRPNGPGIFIPDGTDYWRHSFSRTLIPQTGNAYLAATLQGDDGSVRQFRSDGSEIHNLAGGAARLQALSGGGWTVTDASSNVETYDSAGRLTSIAYRDGKAITITRDISGRISTIMNSFGRSLTLNYGTGGAVASLTIPGGAQITYAYDDRGRLTGVTYPDATSKIYHYENATNGWLLTGITDESGERFSTYVYDEYGRVTSEEHAGGTERNTFSYGDSRQTAMYTTVVDAMGKSRLHLLNNASGVFKLNSSGEYCPGCQNTSAATFDANGNYASKRDLNGNLTTYVHDLTRNLEISRTEGLTSSGNATSVSRTTTTEWHTTLRLPTVIRIYSGAAATGTPLRTTTNTYDSAGNLSTRTIADVGQGISRMWTYTHDSYGRVLTEDGPRTDVGDMTTYSYYNCSNGGECGQLHTVTNALGHVTTYNAYNAHGQPTLITDANGVPTSLVYDQRQRLISSTSGYGLAAAETTTYEYWPTGKPKKVIRPDGSFVLNTYDAAQRLVRVEDGAGNRLDYVLDPAGNRQATNAYDPYGTLVRTQRQLYNSLGQLWQVLTAAGTDTEATVFGYDNSGNATTVSAPLGRVTTNIYDQLNRLRQITDPAGGIVTNGYDALDNLTQVTDPRGLVTTYQYNGLGDVKQLVSPDTGTTTYSYDSGGNAHLVTNARNAVTTNTHDAAGRISSTTFSVAGSVDQAISYTYDAGPNGVGRLTGASDANHSLSWAYDALGRVTNKTQIVGTSSKTVAYSYANGRPAGLLTPSGQSIAYQYDALGRISGISLNGSALIENVTYDPFGPVTGWTWGNGTLTVRNFDLDGRIDLIDSAGFSTYSFNADGTIASRLDDVNASYSLPGGIATIDVSSSSNRLTGASGPLQRAYSYDAAGNVISDGNATFIYNFANRMSSASKDGLTATYTYNALGERVRKIVGAGVTYYFYDEAGKLLGRYDGAGALIEEIVWLSDTPVASVRPSGPGSVTVYYIHTDHLGTPRRVSRPSDNAIIWRWDSDPYGVALPNEDADGDSQIFVFDIRFPGQIWDAESQLHYNYFRDYDPATGRYMQSDPIGLAGGVNTFGYGGENPITNADSLGLFFDSRGVSTLARMTPAGRLATVVGSITGYVLLRCTDHRCDELLAKVEGFKGIVIHRYHMLLNDEHDLYYEAHDKPRLGKRKGSWIGHLQKFKEAKGWLREAINEALAAGCPVPPDAIKWSQVPPPWRPARRTNF